MLPRIALFEIRYWLRGFMVWIFFLIMMLMIGGAASSDQVIVGAALENTNRNAPFAIQNFYAFSSILTLLMTVAFVNSAAARDFANNTAQMIFSKPLNKVQFLLGRFLGSTLIALIPMLGASVGIMLAPLAPWADKDRFAAIDWGAHLASIFVFAVPNVFFVAAIIFTVAALTRSTVTSFLSALILLVAYAVAEGLMSDMKNETLATLLDPFAFRTFSVMTKYWTVAERNTLTVGWEGLMLWNRLLWITVGSVILAAGIARFHFEERFRKGIKTADEASDPVPAALPDAAPRYRSWPQFVGMLRTEFWGLVKSTSFIVIAAAALLNVLPNLIFSANEGYGNQSLPVTYWIVEIITGTLIAFLISIITYYAGVLVWKEREARMDEIQDALPFPAWISYAAKLTALLGVVAILLFVVTLCGIAMQTWHGYTRYQIGLYAAEFFGFSFTDYFFLAVLAFFIHAIAPNKYLGYFLFIAFLIVNAFIWRPVNVATRMVRYMSRPATTYSDLFGWAPYLEAWTWFTLYWLAFALLLIVATLALWPRGKETALKFRLRIGRQSLTGARLASAAVALAVFAGTGAWVYYNTLVRNQVFSAKDTRRRQADYEKTYKKFESLPQPNVQSVRYEIDLYPEARRIEMRGRRVLKNTHAQPLQQVHFTVDDDYESTIEIPGAKLASDDRRLSYRIYQFDPPLAPGAEVPMNFTVKAEPKGFEDSLRRPQIVQNGTFFNNTIAPQIGYQAGAELSDRNDRKDQGLPEKEMMRTLERDCTANCMQTYVGGHSDWVSVETVISTSPDQIAIAPGSLLKEWNQDGRRYFHYKLDRDSLDFYSFLSARYQVAREEWNGVKLEVYYHPEHAWNVPKMLSSMRKSLDYYTKNFGPYAHKQARIIEFPRIARFAQAFPGTMPYSEAVGFIANLNKPDAIDLVYFVVAHEMGHQWWAHQVIGANMQGATLLSETLAEYSALMVMEKEYGPDQMHKFLEYEADRYLRSRGTERLKERPLIRVESRQGYIHYQKGGLVMYHLKEMIGEDAVNRALRKLVDRYAYAAPPYPTSHALVDAIREETPENLRYLIADLFEHITLYSNRTLAASATKRPDGKYDVTIDVEARKVRAGDTGEEVETPMDDVIEIGAFAEPRKGEQYGKLLHRQRVRLQTGRKSFTFTVSELPAKAGIDPRRLLIDRVPDDNMKRIDAT